MKTLGQIVLDVASMLTPPERLSVSEASEKYVRINEPSYVGPWKASKTPYMVEPMNTTQSREHTSVVFCGSAQSGKSQSLVSNVMAFHAICNPMDVILYHMSKPAARDFSVSRVDRGHRNSPEWGVRLLKRAADNTYDKTYKSGMRLLISWPSINEMSSKSIPVVMFTDYDRMPMDIDGEGSPFYLGQKRTTIYRSLGMTIAESSPSHDVAETKDDVDNQSEPGAHEAPPCTGILGLYNQGTRHRWYWPCPECKEFFEGSFANLQWRREDDEGKRLSIPAMVKSTVMVCPHCEARIPPVARDDMNQLGRWLAEGQSIDKHGRISGEARYSKMASFWLKGPAAAYTTWPELVSKYLEAERQFDQTGSEDDLRQTVNQDQAEPYLPKARLKRRDHDTIRQRANKALDIATVPSDVRALIATIDTQKSSWEVQVHGVRPAGDTKFDLVVVDRFRIQLSERVDGMGQHPYVKPASYPEDWDQIKKHVIDRVYPIEGGVGEMEIAFTVCDSGGARADRREDGELDRDMSVTQNAYNYFRRLKRDGDAGRFLLVKGDSNPASPRAHLEHPDSSRNDRHAGARGEVPVLFLNTNSLKDAVSAMLNRDDAGGGMIDVPHSMPEWWFKELTAETRERTGWRKIGGRRNEAWDLLVYCVGVLVYLKIEKIDWTSPPKWLGRHDINPYVRLASPVREVDKEVNPLHRFAELGAKLA